MARGRKKKEQFADLDSDYRTLIDNMKDSEVRDKIAEVAMNQVELMKNKNEDQHLKEVQETAKEAGSQYREGTKMNRLRIEYARHVLEGRGQV